MDIMPAKKASPPAKAGRRRDLRERGGEVSKDAGF